jgi:5'-3' exonuclease
VSAKYGVAAALYPDFAALRGDPSDGLPGVAGIGEKTAAAIVSRFGALEDIVAAADRGAAGFPAGAAAKVVAARDYLVAVAGVVRGRVDLPIDPIADTLPSTPVNPQDLVELSDRYGLDGSINRVLTALSAITS